MKGYIQEAIIRSTIEDLNNLLENNTPPSTTNAAAVDNGLSVLNTIRNYFDNLIDQGYGLDRTLTINDKLYGNYLSILVYETLPSLTIFFNPCGHEFITLEDITVNDVSSEYVKYFHDNTETPYPREVVVSIGILLQAVQCFESVK